MKENPIIHGELQLCVRLHKTEVTLLTGGYSLCSLTDPARCSGSDPAADAGCMHSDCGSSEQRSVRTTPAPRFTLVGTSCVGTPRAFLSITLLQESGNKEIKESSENTFIWLTHEKLPKPAGTCVTPVRQTVEWQQFLERVTHGHG